MSVTIRSRIYVLRLAPCDNATALLGNDGGVLPPLGRISFFDIAAAVLIRNIRINYCTVVQLIFPNGLPVV